MMNKLITKHINETDSHPKSALFNGNFSINEVITGTFIPIFLHSRGIDPAVATGPFITTSNDILGILIYFMIAKIILGF